MISTLTLRPGLPAPSIAQNGERHLSQLADNQIIRVIHNRARRGLGVPDGLTPYDEFGASYRPTLLKARQMTFVLLQDYIAPDYFCTAFGKRGDTASVNHHARRAHRVSMEDERYREVFMELQILITQELSD